MIHEKLSYAQLEEKVACLENRLEEYRILLEMIPQPVCLTELETGGIIFANEKFCRASQYDKKDILGKTLVDLGFLNKEARQKITEELRVSGEVKDREVRCTLRDGSLLDTLQYSRTVGSDQKIRVLTIVLNVTERKEMEAELRQAQKMAAAGALVGGVAHDFNNILTMIVGNTELAMDKICRNDPVRGKLERVLDASFRARDIVSQLFSFSRASSEEKVPMKINYIIKEHLKLLRATIPKSIGIRQNICHDPGVVLANPAHISQLIVILCNRAARAMKEKGGALEICLSNFRQGVNESPGPPSLPGGRYVKLTVRDTGPGNDRNILNRILEPHDMTGNFRQGNGLGLAGVHRIVKDLNGEIIVDSIPGKGTAVDVYLPEIKNRDSVEIESGDGPAPEPSRVKKNILFVDDEELIVEIMRQLLESLGYQVESMSGSFEALEIFRSKPDFFDIVITDMTMPKMNGDQLAKNILGIRPDTPIIMCTGYNEMINEEKAREIGIRALMTKPLKREHLNRKIMEILA